MHRVAGKSDNPFEIVLIFSVQHDDLAAFEVAYVFDRHIDKDSLAVMQRRNEKMDGVRGLFALCAGIHGKIKTTMANGRKSLEIRKRKNF